MLRQRPNPLLVKLEYLELWSKIKPLTVQQLETYWKMVEKKQQLFDPEAEYAEWQGENRELTSVGASGRHAPL